MCRLFGFRSDKPNKVHDSLLTEKNSLRVQSQEHKDGWGIAYYMDKAEPTVVHGLGAAHVDLEYARVSEFVLSHTVVAHVRLASVGAVTLENAHPFVWRHWSFAHNGTLRNFARHRETLEKEIDPKWLRLIKGETDSERCFYLFMTRLEVEAKDFERPTVEEVARAATWTAFFATRTCKPGEGEKPS